MRSIAGITTAEGWTRINPDEHGDWLKQRDDSFSNHMPLGGKRGTASSLFEGHSNGVKTNRDAWAYNASRHGLIANMKATIAFYNAEVTRFEKAHPKLDKKEREAAVEAFIDTDGRKMVWDRPQKAGVARGRRVPFDQERIIPSLYQPFTKQWLYFDHFFNNCVYQMPRLFPNINARNRVIGVSASESRSGFSVMMTDVVPSLHAADMVGSQFFPLYLYSDSDEPGGASGGPTAVNRRDAITDTGLEHFRSGYSNEQITKEDVFYYVYGVLHSPYCERFADSLGKELPRIPRVMTTSDFSGVLQGRARTW